jgi:3-deoxy-D-manno-octulosonate 8-phosphate phosphatase (KDO 8-P phosphatase)
MPPLSPTEISSRCEPIELLVTDVDGVLTDGVIAVDDRGVETKNFHVRDGMGFSLWHRAGKTSAILSGRRGQAVERRAAELDIAHVLLGFDQKTAPFLALVDRLGLSPRAVCYVGDDLPDIPVLELVGFAACPADSADEVRSVVHLVTRAPGGRGAVREVIESILKSQGRWAELIGEFHANHSATLELAHGRCAGVHGNESA